MIPQTTCRNPTHNPSVSDHGHNTLQIAATPAGRAGLCGRLGRSFIPSAASLDEFPRWHCVALQCFCLSLISLCVTTWVASIRAPKRAVCVMTHVRTPVLNVTACSRAVFPDELLKSLSCWPFAGRRGETANDLLLTESCPLVCVLGCV